MTLVIEDLLDHCLVLVNLVLDPLKLEGFGVTPGLEILLCVLPTHFHKVEQVHQLLELIARIQQHLPHILQFYWLVGSATGNLF